MRTLRTSTQNRKKLVATAKRCERIYKRTAEPSVTFCGEEKQWSGWLIFYRVKNRNKRNSFRRERDFLRRGETAERATDFLQGKIIGASGACFDETAGINDWLRRAKLKVFVHLFQNGGIRSFVSLHRAATLCDRYQASLLEASKGRALNRCPQTAEHSWQNDFWRV